MKYSAHINLQDQNSSYTLAFQRIAPGTNVLDVGCASGMVGDFLKKHNQNHLVGIEKNPVFARTAIKRKCYDEVLLADLDKLTAKNFKAKYRKRFDHILLLDIIEHTYSPASTIEALKPLLLPSGTFIFSIPNVAHGSIKLKLLQNKFEYTQMGLLDNTHIRFFTLDNIINLMADTGLEIVSVERVFESFWHTAQIHKKNDYSWYLRHKIAKDLESYTYQYVVTARFAKEITRNRIAIESLKINRNEKDRIKKLLNEREPSFLRRSVRYAVRKASGLFHAGT